MCYPVAIAVAAMALAAASTAVQVKSANDTAKAESEAAKQANIADQVALEARQREIDVQSQGKALEIQKEFMKQRGMLRVAQGESGLVGPTQFRELASLSQEYSGELATVESNRELALAQGSRDWQKIDADYRGRVNKARASSYSGLAAGLQIGSSAMQGAASGYSMGKSLQK